MVSLPPYEEIKYTTWKIPLNYWGGTGTEYQYNTDNANPISISNIYPQDNAYPISISNIYPQDNAYPISNISNIYSQYYTYGGTTCPTITGTAATITGTEWSCTWPLYTPIEGYTWPNSYPIASKQDLEKARLKNNLIIQIKSRASSIEKYPGESEPERRALETLREIISEEEFRKYLRYGFILVKGKSGATYQVFRNASHCKVWLNGQVIEEVCVQIKDKQVPKTDKLIAFKTIIETSEEQFKKLGNVYKMARAA